MELDIKNCSGDPWSIGSRSGVKAEIASPTFDSTKSAWATSLKLTGYDRSREIEILGETALQSLMLAAKFAMQLYEPDMLDE